jgi:hypothetical protein
MSSNQRLHPVASTSSPDQHQVLPLPLHPIADEEQQPHAPALGELRQPEPRGTGRQPVDPTFSVMDGHGCSVGAEDIAAPGRCERAAVTVACPVLVARNPLTEVLSEYDP